MTTNDWGILVLEIIVFICMGTYFVQEVVQVTPPSATSCCIVLIGSLCALLQMRQDGFKVYISDAYNVMDVIIFVV